MPLTGMTAAVGPGVSPAPFRGRSATEVMDPDTTADIDAFTDDSLTGNRESRPPARVPVHRDRRDLTGGRDHGHEHFSGD